jgi:hypothetical protein
VISNSPSKFFFFADFLVRITIGRGVCVWVLRL